MMSSLQSLLATGFFPKELPPPFQTIDFANKALNDPAFVQSLDQIQQTSKIGTHSYARMGGLRRRFGLVNPLTYSKLCKEIELNWDDITICFRRSKISRSIPKLGPMGGRALIPGVEHKELCYCRVATRATSKYILQTDIARFYPSVYTHSIPWAVHTKVIAKAQRNNPQLWGNSIDKCVRNGQDGQTIGIPIGPDSSLAISEIIMSAVDEEISNKMTKLKGFRYVDDYEFGFKTLSEAEELLAILQETLDSYGLELNSEKTRIIELPEPLDPPWVHALRDFDFNNNGRNAKLDILRYFDIVFAYYKQNKKHNVLAYALSRLRSYECDQTSWNTLQDLLLECVSIEPAAMIYVFSLLIVFSKQGLAINKEALEEILNHLIQVHGLLGHSSEVAWAIWIIVVFDLKIKGDASRVISKMSDSIVALLAIDAENRGLLSENLEKSNWEHYMDMEGLYGENWLLSYEANIKGWLPSTNQKDHVERDVFFSKLKQANVEFYKSQDAIVSVPTFIPPSSGYGPLFRLIERKEDTKVFEEDIPEEEPF